MASSTETRRRYGKNWEKWLALYLAVGAVVYLVISLALSAGGGSGGGLYSRRVRSGTLRVGPGPDGNIHRAPRVSTHPFMIAEG